MFRDEYFQGILQLRDSNKEIVDFVKKKVKEENRPGVYISREVELKNGVDLYFTSNKTLRKIGKLLKKSFVGEFKESEQLFSRDNLKGKNLYRLNVLFRPAKFKVGDIVESKGEKYKVKAVGKKVQAMDLKTGKRVLLNYKGII